jgi:hypothetical protein
VSPYETSLRRLERWIESIDKEMDYLAKSMLWETLTPIERGFIPVRLELLQNERQRAADLLARLELFRDRPELMFSARPKHAMLRASLRRRKSDRKAG